MLEAVMTIVNNIKGFGVKPEMSILEFVTRFKIDSDKNSIVSKIYDNTGYHICLCHVLHLYEIIERTQLKKLMQFIELERPDVDRNNRRIQEQIEECPHQVNAVYFLRLSPDQKDKI